MDNFLFSEKLGVAKTDQKLLVLQSQYKKYDPSYVCQSVREYSGHRLWMEELWEQYKSYADKGFIGDFKMHFSQRAWELYLGATFLNRGFSLEMRKFGPDFSVHDIKTNTRLAWVEATSVQKGNGVEKVPETVFGRVVSVPTEQMLLRLSGALSEKFKQYSSWLNSVVAINEPFVIAIDRSELEHVDVIPLILKVLFGIGDYTLTFKSGASHHEPNGSYWSDLASIKKRNGNPVTTNFFLDPSHTGISAVIYSNDGILNSPRQPTEMGENFIMIHNPLAKNPLPAHIFPFGTEYMMKGDLVECIRESKKFTKPDIFHFEENIVENK